ncbi:MAG: hypothetical protein ACOYJY_05500 [Acutalibacteraceae bacterium]|jgi:hypothetical protein
MSPKELQYVEDALGHEQHFLTQCEATASQLQDGELRACVERQLESHRQLFQRFYQLV